MSEINLPPFYVGQKVIRVVPETHGLLKVGSKYIVSQIKYCCKIWGWKIELIGIDRNTHLGCECGNAESLSWACKNFAPIEETFQSISLEKVIEKETPLVCSN